MKQQPIAALLLGSIVLLGVGCTGGVHRQGEHQLTLTGAYGQPFFTENLWPDAEGDGENASFTIGYTYFAQDRIGLRVAGTPYRNYRQSDGDTYAGEFQVGVRYYFWEFDLLERPVALFAEALGGLTYSERSVPEDEGSHTNFTQDTGLGFEWHLSEDVSWIGGYHLKHLSHGRIWRGGRNPSQNDHFVFTGAAIKLR